MWHFPKDSYSKRLVIQPYFKIFACFRGEGSISEFMMMANRSLAYESSAFAIVARDDKFEE
jgi:hypothetical protein